MKYLKITLVVCFVLFFAGPVGATLIKHDITYRGDAGGGAGVRPPYFTNLQVFSGFIQYDLEHANVVDDGNNIYFYIEPAFARFYMDFNGLLLDFSGLTIHLQKSSRKLQFIISMLESFISIPNYDVHPYDYRNMVMTHFSMNFIFSEIQSLDFNKSLSGTSYYSTGGSSNRGHWDVSSHGRTTISKGYIVDGDTPRDISEPPVVSLLLFLVAIFICRKLLKKSCRQSSCFQVKVS